VALQPPSRFALALALASGSALVSVSLAGCWTLADPGTAGSGGMPGGGTGGATGGTGGAGGGPPAGSGGAGAGVCARWRADRADRAEGAWSGSVAACDAGDVAAPGRVNALRQVNLFRYLAGLPEVTESAAKTATAQACALMLEANRALSHEPPATWTCFTQAGADGAGQSNIATVAGVAAVDLYMADPGNATTIGHRRWILSNSLDTVGLGSAARYSCLQVLGGRGNAGKAYTAWPPAGEVPLEALAVRGGVDATGWTIQSDSINLGSAQVTVTDAGVDLPVMVVQLGANYGSRWALRFVPQGWGAQAGHTYAVSVAGTSPAISYSVAVLACP
jgi:hypothetical protein